MAAERTGLLLLFASKLASAGPRFVAPRLSSSSHRKRRRGGRCMREDRGGVRLIERRGPTAGAADCCSSLLQLLDAEIHRDNLIPYGIMDSSGSG